MIYYALRDTANLPFVIYSNLIPLKFLRYNTIEDVILDDKEKSHLYDIPISWLGLGDSNRHEDCEGYDSVLRSVSLSL